jgi:hypothetical protein
MVDWAAVADQILGILVQVREHPQAFAAAAAERGITVDQLTASSIAGMLASMLESKHQRSSPRRRSRP